jgi:hypothetical protein
MKKSDSMSSQQEIAIDCFFSSVDRLRDLGVVRSNKYLGDIAEFLCSNLFGMELAESKKQKGHDGTIDGLRCQVKFSGGSSQTIDLGNPELYDRLIIVLGPESALRHQGTEGRWLVFNIPSEVILRKNLHNDGLRRYTKAQLPLDHFVGGFNFLKEIESSLLHSISVGQH